MIQPLGNTVGSLSSAQHAVLVGSLLGDGTLRRQGNKRNALFEVNHSFKFKEYVDWKWQHFSEYVLTPPKPRAGNGKRVAYRFTTRSLPVFTNYHRWFYDNGKKRVPSDLELDALSLAVWFMDDGSKSRGAWYLNTQQFSLPEQDYLRGLLKRTFGIENALNRDKQYFLLRMSIKDTRSMSELIGSYVLPCLRHKLVRDPVTTESKDESFPVRGAKTPTPAMPGQMTAPRSLPSTAG
jgi:hypothetical protein